MDSWSCSGRVDGEIEEFLTINDEPAVRFFVSYPRNHSEIIDSIPCYVFGKNIQKVKEFIKKHGSINGVLVDVRGNARFDFMFRPIENQYRLSMGMYVIEIEFYTFSDTSFVGGRFNNQTLADSIRKERK